MASLDQAAAHCFISSQRFRELLARGVIAKAERGRYDLDKVREQFIRHLSKMAAGRADSGSRLVEERTRLVAAKRRREERQDALEAGRLVPFAPIQRFIENGLRVTRDRLLNLPGELATCWRGARRRKFSTPSTAQSGRRSKKSHPPNSPRAPLRRVSRLRKMNRSTEKMQMSKQRSDQPAGFRVHPNGEIELLSARETWDIVVRTINAAVARGLGGRRRVY